MTIDDVLQKLKEDNASDIEEALAWQVQDGGELVFSLGIDRRAKADIDALAAQEAMRPENLKAELDALKAKMAELEAK